MTRPSATAAVRRTQGSLPDARAAAATHGRVQPPDRPLPPAPELGRRVDIPLDQLHDYLLAHRLHVLYSEWPEHAPAPIVYLTNLRTAPSVPEEEHDYAAPPD
jgi:hypothetical protein